MTWTAAVALCLCAAACAAPGKRAAPAAAEPAMAGEAAPMAETGQLRQEIETLDAEIQQWRVDVLELDAVPSEAAISAAAAAPGREPTRDCELGDQLSPTCQKVCEVADSICDNAGRICRIADDLAGDPWATDKCNSAKASCAEAQQRCCGCAQNAE